MIRVVVIEDEPLAREHLVDLLAELPGVSVVASAENGRLGLAAIAEQHPDAVFLDIEMPVSRARNSCTCCRSRGPRSCS